jgi:hypothetical protein
MPPVFLWGNTRMLLKKLRQLYLVYINIKKIHVYDYNI